MPSCRVPVRHKAVDLEAVGVVAADLVEQGSSQSSMGHSWTRTRWRAASTRRPPRTLEAMRLTEVAPLRALASRDRPQAMASTLEEAVDLAVEGLVHQAEVEGANSATRVHLMTRITITRVAIRAAWGLAGLTAHSQTLGQDSDEVPVEFPIPEVAVSAPLLEVADVEAASEGALAVVAANIVG